MAIHALPGVGYRLEHPLELLEAAAIESDLTPTAAGLLQGMQIHDALESTNTFLMKAARADVQSGTVCLAEAQTHGRGRLGRIWQSPFAGNVYLSVLWRFSSTAVLGGLSLAIGTLVARALRASGVEGVGLKWPNDILWNERKLGGVLIEVSGEVCGQCAVVIGIGINYSLSGAHADAIDQPAVDLRHIQGRRAISRNRLIAQLLNQLLPALADFEGRGFAVYVDEWRRYHAFDGRPVTVEQGTRAIHGLIADVTASGTLLLDCEDGGRREFSSGDVRLRVAGP